MVQPPSLCVSRWEDNNLITLLFSFVPLTITVQGQNQTPLQLNRMHVGFSLRRYFEVDEVWDYFGQYLQLNLSYW